MEKELLSAENANISNTSLPQLLQVGDKNTQVAHANHVVINNLIYPLGIVSADVAPVGLNFIMSNTLKQGGQTKIDTDYYNLFVTCREIKNCRFTIDKDRALKANTEIVRRLSDMSRESIAEIKTFPSLFMNENTDYDNNTAPEQEAYFGFVKDIKIQENGFLKVRFLNVATIQQQRINEIIFALDILGAKGVTELNQTHWTIKNVNLIEELTDAGLLPTEVAL